MRLRETVPADLDFLLGWVPPEADMGSGLGEPSSGRWIKGSWRATCRMIDTGTGPGWTRSRGDSAGHASLLVDTDASMMRLGCILLDPAARGRGLGWKLISAGPTDNDLVELIVYAEQEWEERMRVIAAAIDDLGGGA